MSNRKFDIRRDALNRYFWFIKERHDIYLRRFVEKELYPWTKDAILKTYKFTNVFRELDRVTIWVRENIREPYAGHPDLFFNLMMARLFNWPPTLAKIGFVENWDREKVYQVVHELRESNVKFTTGAFMVTGTLGGKGTKKDDQLVNYCLDPLWKLRHMFVPRVGDTLESACDRIADNTPGFGRFLTYEVITDLRHTRYLGNAKDIMTWANPGPGAHRGLRRLLGLGIDVKGTRPRSPERKYRMEKWPNDEEAIHLMRYILGLVIVEEFPEFEMRDVEHTLCEFDKYERIRLQQGRLRSRYQPGKSDEFPSLVK